jgi:hypothetical protein
MAFEQSVFDSPSHVLEGALAERFGMRRRSRSCGGGGSGIETSSIDSESIGIAEDHRCLNHLLQLADISRPVVGRKHLQGLLVHIPNRFVLIFLSGKLDEVRDEQRDILPPFAQGRYFDREGLQAVIKILTKCACSDGGFEVAIRGRNHAHVSSNRCSTAGAVKDLIVQDAKQSSLDLESELPNFVQEDRPTFGYLKMTQVPFMRPSEGAFFMSEKLCGAIEVVRLPQLTVTSG